MSKFEKDTDVVLDEHLRSAERIIKNLKVNGAVSKHLRMRLNSNDTMSLARALTAIEQKVIAEPFAANSVASLLSAPTNLASGHRFYEWSYSKQSGAFKVGANGANDLSVLNSSRVSKVSKLERFSAAYEYTIEDVEALLLQGVDLPAEGAMNVRRGYEEALEELVLFGNAASGLGAGLMNQTIGTGDDNVRETESTSASWVGAINGTSAAVMLDDLSRLVAEYARDCKGLYKPTHLILAPSAVYRMRQARLEGNGETVELHFLRNNPSIKIVECGEADRDVDAHGTYGARGLLFANRDDVVQKLLAAPLQFEAAQADGLKFIVPAHFKAGGVAIKMNVAMRYLSDMPNAT